MRMRLTVTFLQQENKKNEDSFSCLSLNVLNLTMQKKWVMWAFDWKVYDIVVYIVCLTVGQAGHTIKFKPLEIKIDPSRVCMEEFMFKQLPTENY